tara:strand:- start:216 stop:365 length:150 start_codon:yes stop_codon:yes gene_type:complete
MKCEKGKDIFYNGDKGKWNVYKKNKKRCKGFTLKYKRNEKDIFYNGDKI